jgi:glyoxylase-like metal-dependent hydrolase (beta-lactamase superfamily II)
MPGSDDLARKILSTKTRQDRDRPNEDNVIFWTGDKLGMVSFTGDTLFTPDDFHEKNKEVAAEERQRQQYSQRMREALEKQADDARFVQGLGL